MGLLSCPGSFLAEMQNGQNWRDWSGKAACIMLTLLQCCFPKGLKVGVRKLKQLEAAKQISDSNSLPKKEENGRMELQMVGSD